ncbi:hypothetical protein BKA70DRAFT_1243616 [Coprinopsis sp. MPI-PUGE-AT-0042]|nr:hypothetical protein BKA70DRAFT_1243616 [Coprinopsis sp. MPI-PUGE-AT-0042]
MLTTVTPTNGNARRIQVHAKVQGEVDDGPGVSDYVGMSWELTPPSLVTSESSRRRALIESLDGTFGEVTTQGSTTSYTPSILLHNLYMLQISENLRSPSSFLRWITNSFISSILVELRISSVDNFPLKVLGAFQNLRSVYFDTVGSPPFNVDNEEISSQRLVSDTSFNRRKLLRPSLNDPCVQQQVEFVLLPSMIGNPPWPSARSQDWPAVAKEIVKISSGRALALKVKMGAYGSNATLDYRREAYLYLDDVFQRALASYEHVKHQSVHHA